VVADHADQSLANERTLRRSMDRISSLDAGGVLNCLSADHLMQLLYEAGVGDLDKADFCDLLEMFTQFRQFTITLTHVYPMADPDMLVARYQGDCRGRNKDMRYANEYLGLFQFRDSLITSRREYDNPPVSHAATPALVGTSS
jgi:ketosteroid isomerase-like protein